jgi:hypothetical protein
MLHVADIFNIDIVEPPVNIDNDRDSHGSFGGGHGDDEQSEKMPLQLVGVQVFIENDEIDIHRVQHQFDRHEDGDQVPSDQEPVDPYKEHDCGDNQEMNDGYALYHDVLCYQVNLFSFLQ